MRSTFINHPIWGLCFLSLILACKPMGPPAFDLETYLRQQDGTIAKVLHDPAKFRIQISYIQVDRDSGGKPHFTPHTYRLSAAEYFYPASTVKLPAALLSLQKLALLHQEGLDRDTPMLTDSLGRTSGVYADSSSANGLPSIGHYIRKIFLVSDNDAFNRLYEFLGQGPFNSELKRMGFEDVRITHRLSIALSEDENRHTNAVKFGESGDLYQQSDRINRDPFAWPERILIGEGELQGDRIVSGPKDFTRKNSFPLTTQQEILRRFIFPETVLPPQRFVISETDRQFAL
ncbi:MAG: serine hydrolase, partial [Bacteroidota bacterium]